MCLVRGTRAASQGTGMAASPSLRTGTGHGAGRLTTGRTLQLPVTRRAMAALARAATALPRVLVRMSCAAATGIVAGLRRRGNTGLPSVTGRPVLTRGLVVTQDPVVTRAPLVTRAPVVTRSAVITEAKEGRVSSRRPMPIARETATFRTVQVTATVRPAVSARGRAMVRRATMVHGPMGMRCRMIMARQPDTAAPVTTGRLPGTGSAPRNTSDRQVATGLAGQRGMTRPAITIVPPIPLPGMTMIGGLATVRLLATGREGGQAQRRVTDPMHGTEPRRATAMPGFRAGFRRTSTDREVAAGTAKQFDGMRPAVPLAGMGRRNRPGRGCPAIARGRGMRTRHGAGRVHAVTDTARHLARCQHRGAGRGYRVTHPATGGAGRRERTDLS
jgi:hypothetical protein